MDSNLLTYLYLHYYTEKSVSLIYGQRKNFLKLKKVLFIQKKISLNQWNRLFYIKKNFFESIKLSSIQRNVSLIQRKYFLGVNAFLTPKAFWLFLLTIFQRKFCLWATTELDRLGSSLIRSQSINDGSIRTTFWNKVYKKPRIQKHYL